MLKDQPPWLDQKPSRTYPPLTQNHQTEVVVIGAGITGVITAYLLNKAGKQVTLIDAAAIGPGGATGWTTAFITSVIDTSLSQLITLFGREKTKAIYQSQLDAISFLRSVINKEKIACDFNDCSAYSYTEDAHELAGLQEEQQLMKKFGFPSRFSGSNDLPIPALGYLEIPGQAKFDSVKFIRALAEKAHQGGLSIFEQTRAESIEGEGPITVKTSGGTITAADVIVATHAPFNNPPAVRAKKGGYTTYVLEAQIPKGALPEALYSDLENPYHYFRIDRADTHDRLILGGEDHRQELKFLRAKSFRLLEQYAAKLLKGKQYTITRCWDGQILESVDGLPFIGQVAPHQFAATGFGGNGMTYGPIAAMVFRDLLTNKPNPAAELYKAKREPTAKQFLTKASHYLQEFWNGAFLKLFR